MVLCPRGYPSGYPPGGTPWGTPGGYPPSFKAVVLRRSKPLAKDAFLLAVVHQRLVLHVWVRLDLVAARLHAQVRQRQQLVELTLVEVAHADRVYLPTLIQVLHRRPRVSQPRGNITIFSIFIT